MEILERKEKNKRKIEITCSNCGSKLLATREDVLDAFPGIYGTGEYDTFRCPCCHEKFDDLAPMGFSGLLTCEHKTEYDPLYPNGDHKYWLVTKADGTQYRIG